MVSTVHSTCSRGQWSCWELPCPGTCAVLGGAHFSTFDERQYTVHGDCSYVLAKVRPGARAHPAAFGHGRAAGPPLPGLLSRRVCAHLLAPPHRVSRGRAQAGGGHLWAELEDPCPQPCDSGAFTVLGELRRCGLTDSETCLKSLTLSLDGGSTVRADPGVGGYVVRAHARRGEGVYVPHGQ